MGTYIKMIAAIYIRKSREDKARPGFRLTAQREQLPAFARSQGWQIEVYDDGHASAARGKTEDLKERGRLETDIRAGKINIILVIELSRLSRDDSMQDYVAWLHLCGQHGVKLATTSRILDPAMPSDWMLLLMEGGFSSVEMKVLQGRMKEGRDQAFKGGKFLGGKCPPPYVHDKAKGQPVIDPQALTDIRKVWELAETMSAKAVAQQTGWPHIAVRRAISDERLLFYQALRLDPQTGEHIPCEWPPCMEADQAARIMANRKNRLSGYNRAIAAGLLSNLGLFTCGYCGRSVRAWKNGRVRKDGTRLDYYGCKANETQRLCAKSRMVPQHIIDERVTTNLLGTMDNIAELQAAWLATQGDDNTSGQLTELDRKEADQQARKKRLVAAVAEGIIDFADAKTTRSDIEAAILAIQKQRTGLQATVTTTPDWDSLSFTGEEFAVLTRDEQREVIGLAIANIRLYSTYLIIEYRFPRTMTGDRTARVHLPFRKPATTAGSRQYYKLKPTEPKKP
ncbi:MAG: hypothetical protein CXR31_04540 [Geobacter sp.]|nr:MAG: hypothetical protein CXR31_04540 [Geobacter sp.]